MAESATEPVGTAVPYPRQTLIEEEPEESIDLTSFFRRLAAGKNTILVISLVFLLLATAVAFLISPKFTSDVAFIPPSLGGGNSMASALSGQLSALGAGDLLGAGKTSAELYAGILKSRSIAAVLVKRFDLMHIYKADKESVAEKVLNSNTFVAVDPKSGIVTVSVTDTSPERARDIANAYMEELRATNGRLALGQSSQRRMFFGDQLTKEKDDLENAEVELKKTEEQSGLIAPSGQTEAQIRTIAETQAQVALRQVQLAALLQSATEQNPEVVRLRSEINDLQGQLSRLQRGNGNGASLTIPTAKVPEVQLDYVRKEREVKYHEALFEMLSRQYEAARLDEARDAPVVQVLDPASLPDTKSSPKRKLIMLGGLIFGLFAGCFWVLIRERLHVLRASLGASVAA
jgi:tyrosine-protein kinase Etk/Wzc